VDANGKKCYFNSESKLIKTAEGIYVEDGYVETQRFARMFEPIRIFLYEILWIQREVVGYLVFNESQMRINFNIATIEQGFD